MLRAPRGNRSPGRTNTGAAVTASTGRMHASTARTRSALSLRRAPDASTYSLWTPHVGWRARCAAPVTSGTGNQRAEWSHDSSRAFHRRDARPAAAPRGPAPTPRSAQPGTDRARISRSSPRAPRLSTSCCSTSAAPSSPRIHWLSGPTSSGTVTSPTSDPVSATGFACTVATRRMKGFVTTPPSCFSTRTRERLRAGSVTAAHCSGIGSAATTCASAASTPHRRCRAAWWSTSRSRGATTAVPTRRGPTRSSTSCTSRDSPSDIRTYPTRSEAHMPALRIRPPSNI